MLITMPQLGETVTEGTIVQWFKAVGDAVDEDEPLFEVSTDKVDTEVPSAVAGTLTEILAPEGATVAIGAALAVITTDTDGDTEADRSDGASAAVADTDAPTVTPAPRPEAASPTGAAPADATMAVAPGARITRGDVAARIAARDRPLTDAATPRDRGIRASASPTTPTAIVAAPGDRAEPFTSVRRRTGAHMRQSIDTAAHTLVVMPADYSGVEEARGAVRDDFRAREDFGLTALPFVARAVIDAIREWPRVNATVAADALLVHPAVHLGIAVDLDFEGLVVPVVRDAGTLRLRALARAVHDRSTAARERRLTADDLTGGTFTITNAGGYGTLVTAPIIHQPQVAIVSMDGIAMRPVAVPVDGGTGHGVGVRPIGNLSLSFDHRAFDGAYASAFLARVVDIVEHREWPGELA